MKIIHCDHCQNVVFFENVKCLNCGHVLGFIPHIQQMVSLDIKGDGLYTTPNPEAKIKLIGSVPTSRIKTYVTGLFRPTIKIRFANHAG